MENMKGRAKCFGGLHVRFSPYASRHEKTPGSHPAQGNDINRAGVTCPWPIPQAKTREAEIPWQRSQEASRRRGETSSACARQPKPTHILTM
jgi:hypothetical protein